MRLGVLADIHANLVALEAVLADGSDQGVDAWYSLGDVLGYGPQPAECLDRIAQLDVEGIRGNHEARVLELPTGIFNEMAEAAIEYTRERLEARHLEQIRAFRGQIDLEGHILFCHGSPADRDEYLFLLSQLQSVVAEQSHWLVFCGHTHQQFLFDGREIEPGAGMHALDTDRRYLVNPGSVGQPRDGDPRASYAVLDLETMQLYQRRIEYDVEEQIRIVEAAALPNYLGTRLRKGR